MASYITHLEVSLNQTEEQMFQKQGFNKIDVDLNKQAEGKFIYLWYKKACGAPPITRLQVTFINDMCLGLIKAGYTKIPKDLNAGAGGVCIYLWYFSGNTEYDIPIVDIDVTTAAKDEGRKFSSGWEKVACDLNRNVGGDWIHAWVKRERQTYICDVTATDSYGSDAGFFQDGFIRVDEDTNRDGGGSFVFIWYRQTTDSKRALNDLQISTNHTEYQQLQQQKYKPVSVNLNEGTAGGPVYLWSFKKEGFKPPVKVMTLLINLDAVKFYEEAGVSVVKRNLNTENNGITEYLCFYQ